MNKIILITGGARSGKSEFAEELAQKLGKEESLAYIATAQIYDEEMRQRVLMHQARRDKQWQTFEAPYHAAETIRASATSNDVILFDCLTLYLTNLLLAPDHPQDDAAHLDLILQEIDQLLVAARGCGKTVLFVTNEVGAGIVPENALARKYRDWAGWVNQKVAKTADEVYFVVCGLPVEIKSLAKSV
ncbi:MAG: bifunctional adenosylcobinamide kinase/adenosylcobinamide-phosphate guanylyltransferase [Sporomusaceae bacterium]|nr:bifunctional adenosylcobinamide kinase/adenosylcobinamide-phosphate guanylyltransferase [Sporomusaceae bacterium]